MKNTDKKVVKKSTKKTTKKVTKFVPSMIYDVTMCENLEDVFYIFGATNLIYGLPLTAEMEEALIAGCKDDILALATDLFDGDILVRHNGHFVEPKIVKTVTIEQEKPVTKKPNIFKRFWNWITRKK